MSERDVSLVIDKFRLEERLDIYLRGHFPMVSRGYLQKLLEQGDIKVNGHPVKSTYTPRLGDRVDVHWPEPRSTQAQPEEIPLTVLYEDEDLVVLNKPPGLVVHPSNGHEEHTLVNALLHHCKGQLSGIGGVARPGIVHRLDKDTSGCLVVAKNDITHVGLQDQFKERSLDKTYHAIVCGVIPTTKGEIRAAITRHPTHRKRMTALDDGDGREAWTSYHVMERLNFATLVENELHTGRTHQIRVHMLYLGHAVVGDELYGKKQNAKMTDQTGYTPPRQMLHASKLEFIHPRTKKKVKCEAPWPADFVAALDILRADKVPDEPRPKKR